MGILDRLANTAGIDFHGNQEKASVRLEDLKKGIWETADGKNRIRVISLEPFNVLDCSTDQALFFQDGLEGLRRKLEDEGYRFSAVQPQPKATIPGDLGESGAAVVININEARGRGNIAGTENHASGEELGRLQQQIFAKLKEMTKLLQGTENEEVKATILRLSEETRGLYQEGLTEEEQTERMRTIFAEVDTFSTMMQEKKPVVKGSARAARRAAARAAGETTVDAVSKPTSGGVAVEGTVFVNDKNAKALLQALKIAPKFQEPVAVSALDTQAVTAPADVPKPKVEKKSQAKKSDEPKKEAEENTGEGNPKTGDTGGPKGPEGPEEWLLLLNIADPVKAREKAAFLEGFIADQYEEYVRYMQYEAKKIQPNGTISRDDCWSLWQKNGGETKLEDAVARHLLVFHDVDPENGKKVFQALVNDLERKANKKV